MAQGDTASGYSEHSGLRRRPSEEKDDAFLNNVAAATGAQRRTSPPPRLSALCAVLLHSRPEIRFLMQVSIQALQAIVCLFLTEATPHGYDLIKQF